MIEVRCSCGHRFGVDEDAAGLTADCPRCGEDVPVPPEGPEPLALDPTSAPPGHTQTLAGDSIAPPPENPLDQADGERTLDYSRGISLDEFSDAIAQPTIGFFRDVLRSFAVLFGGRNWSIPIMMAIVDVALLVVVILMLAFTGSPVFVAIVSTLALLPLAWHCAIFFRACRAACAGDDQIKLVALQEGVWEDLIKPFGQFVACWWLAMLPMWLYLAFLAFAGSFRPPVEVALAVLCLCLLLWPAAILLIALGDSVTALTPRNLLRLIAGALWVYLLVWAALVGVAALGIAAGVVARHALGQVGVCPLLGLYAILLLVSMTGLLMMRVIGLMYHHFKARLSIEAE